MVGSNKDRDNVRRRPLTKPSANYYRGQNNAEASPFTGRHRPGRLSRFVNGGLDLLIILTIVLGLLYSLYVSSSAKVQPSSLKYRSAAEYKAAVVSQIGQLKDRTKLTFDEKTLVNALQSKYPEVSSASVELPLFSTQPVVRLVISQPAFLLQSSGSTYIVDADGMVVDSSAKFSKVRGLPVITDQSGYKITPGKPALSRGAASFIYNLIGQLNHAKIPIKSLELPTAAQEVYLHTADRPYYVKFYLSGDVLQQAGQYLAARHNLDTKGKQPEQYLDVRVPGKIFYR